MRMQYEQRTTLLSPFLSLFIACMLLVSFVPILSSSAATDTQFSVVPASQTIAPGSTVLVNISVTPGEAIEGVQVDISYNASLLTLTTVNPGDFFNASQSYPIINYDNASGTFTYAQAAFNETNVTQQGNLATITFTATDASGTTMISLSEAIAVGTEEQQLTTMIENGTVTVQQPPTHLNVVPSETQLKQKQTFTVDVTVDPAEPIAGVGLSISYDPSLLQIVNIEEGNLFNGYATQFDNGTIDTENGTLADLWLVITVPNGSISDTGTAAIITFQSKSTDGTSPLNLTEARVWTPEAQQTPTQITNATVQVTVQPTTITVQPATTQARPGENLTVDIVVDPAEPIAGVQYTLAFNQSLLTAITVTEGDLFQGKPSYFTPGTIDNDNGTITNVAGSLTPADGGITNSGIFATIQFTVNGTGTSLLNITSAIIGDPNGTEVPLTIQNTTITSSYQVTYHLKAGWNLITIPIEHTYTAESLGQAITNCDTIAEWNVTNQDYETHPVGAPGLNNFAIQDGYAYFVHVTTDTTFIVNGTPITPPTVDLQPGWNMIGYTTWQTTTAENIGNSIENCDTIMQWNPITQQYVGHPIGTPVHDFTVNTGHGLFIHVTQQSTYP